jgi:Zn-dependent peptidase ImmA (M78 family)
MNKEKLQFYINSTRFKYLLDLYKLSKEEFILLFNRNKINNQINIDTLNKILDNKLAINEDFLKHVNKIFNNGITWLISNRPILKSKEKSIFFRKNNFNSELSFESKKLINKYEELKFEINILSEKSGRSIERVIKKYKISDNPEAVAEEIAFDFGIVERKLLLRNVIKRPKNDKDFLSNLIRIIEDFNIFIFEFVETWNKKEKADFDGFCILPSILVLKRQQKYLRREIFTLLHEFAHYLIYTEEVDDLVDESIKNNEIEKWCNDFAFSFLIGNKKDEFNKLTFANSNNNYLRDAINKIYSDTHLSISAIYTRLLINKKITKDDYQLILEEIKDNIRREEADAKMKKYQQKEAGIEIKGFSPRPIDSLIFKDLVINNYFSGNISENEVRNYLKVGAKKSIDEVLYVI